MGCDASQSLADCLNMPLTDDPVEVAPNLWAQEVDPLERLERYWPAIEQVLAQTFDKRISSVVSEELSLIPGLSDLLRLLSIKEHCDAGEYEVLVVDPGPSLSALQLLSYPEGAAWWVDRLLGDDGAADPLAAGADSLAESLSDLRRTLGDADQTSVRLVMTAEQLALRETKRVLTFLSLYGFNVDALVLNRQKYVPPSVADAFAAWPVLCVTLYDRDIIGIKLLAEMSHALFPPSEDPASIMVRGPAQRLSRTGDGYVLSLKLPFVGEDDIDLMQHNGELILQVGRVRRVIPLPSPVDALGAADAVLEEGVLEIRFE